MGYTRQHSDAGRVRAVACVLGEPGKFLVRIIEADANATTWWSHGGVRSYHSREVAFAAADILARHRLGGHECNADCSEWVGPS